jgi:hypothetical protein
MTRFYVCEDNEGSTFDCTLKRSEAVTILKASGGGKLVTVDVKVNTATVARLLGHLGGYADRVTETMVRP